MDDSVVTQPCLVGGDTSEREKQLQRFIAEQLAQKRPHAVKIGETSIPIRKQIDRIIASLQVIKPLGNAMAAVDPIHIGLPWAGVCMVLSVSESICPLTEICGFYREDSAISCRITTRMV